MLIKEYIPKTKKSIPKCKIKSKYEVWPYRAKITPEIIYTNDGP